MVNFRLFQRFLLFAFLSFVALLALAKDASDYLTVSELPKEAQVTLALIQKGGPFPYTKDGIIFGNYESRLPKQKRGYYHEYTVPTPGAKSRGFVNAGSTVGARKFVAALAQFPVENVVEIHDSDSSMG